MNNVNIITDNNTPITPNKDSLLLTGSVKVNDYLVIDNDGNISVNNIKGLSDYLTQFGELHNYISYGDDDPEGLINLIINGGNSKTT